jgi:hypothetical protein
MRGGMGTDMAFGNRAARRKPAIAGSPRGNDLILTLPRSMRVEEPARQLDDLFRRLVLDPPNAACRRVVQDRVMQAAIACQSFPFGMTKRHARRHVVPGRRLEHPGVAFLKPLHFGIR